MPSTRGRVPQRGDRVLTVQQPWAALIVAGVKVTEHRTWTTSYRGLLWVHAARELDRDAPPYEGPLAGVRGAIIGHVELVHVLGDASHRNFLWQLAGPHELAGPIPCRGYPSIWRVPAGLIAGKTGE